MKSLYWQILKQANPRALIPEHGIIFRGTIMGRAGVGMVSKETVLHRAGNADFAETIAKGMMHVQEADYQLERYEGLVGFIPLAMEIVRPSSGDLLIGAIIRGGELVWIRPVWDEDRRDYLSQLLDAANQALSDKEGLDKETVLKLEHDTRLLRYMLVNSQYREYLSSFVQRARTKLH